MRLIIMECLIALICMPVFSVAQEQSLALSGDWVVRPFPEEPATEEERLAVSAASEHKDMLKNNLAAKYEGVNGPYESVTVTVTPESDSEMQMMFKYRIVDGQIYASTNLAYKTLIEPEIEIQKRKAEEVAYGLAVRYNGVGTERPVISGDKAIAVKFEGNCNAIVTEKTFDFELVAEYRFDMCK